MKKKKATMPSEPTKSLTNVTFREEKYYINEQKNTTKSSSVI